MESAGIGEETTKGEEGEPVAESTTKTGPCEYSG